MWIFPILLCVALTQTNAATLSGCSINIKPDFRHQWPLVYQKNGELLPTKVVEINDDDHQLLVETPANTEILLSCGPNYFKKFGRESVLQVKCDKANNNFEILTNSIHKGDKKPINDLTCDLRVIEEVLATVDGCSNTKLTATNFGYVEPIEKETNILGEACYDEAKGHTLFAHIRLGNTKASSTLRLAAKNFLTTQKYPNGRYKIELFRGLFFDELMERIRTTLKVTHVPDLNMANLIDESLLSSSQFQAVKKLGWNYFLANGELSILKDLKQNIRDLSTTHNLDIWIGAYGVKTFYGDNDKELKLYLHNTNNNGRFPMPEYIWLLVKDREQSKAIGFLVANTELGHDALVRPNDTPFCRNQCDKLTWLNESLKRPNVVNKLLSCCTYEDLKNVITDIPDISVKNDKILL